MDGVNIVQKVMWRRVCVCTYYLEGQVLEFCTKAGTGFEHTPCSAIRRQTFTPMGAAENREWGRERRVGESPDHMYMYMCMYMYMYMYMHMVGES